MILSRGSNQGLQIGTRVWSPSPPAPSPAPSTNGRLFVAWIMIIYRRQICIFLPLDSSPDSLNGHQSCPTTTPSLQFLPWLHPLALSLPYFYAIFAHVRSSRMQKCRNIYVPRVSNTSKNNSMWLSCIEHCSKKAEKVARGEGHKLLVFYWMKWHAWRWFINVPKSS